MSTKNDTDTSVNIQQNIKEPPMFKVVYLNDNTTSIEFVIESLIDIFSYSVPTAEKLTNDIHETGSAVVAVLPYEMAEQKGVEVTISARANGFPLQVKLEPED